MSEFARPIRLDEIGVAPVRRQIAAEEAERAAIARRLDLLELDRLEAVLDVRRADGGIEVSGEVKAVAAQACVLTGLPVPARVREPVLLRFASGTKPEADEVELAAADLDTLPLEGGAIDLGEVAVETLALALPNFPCAEGPEADAIRALLVSEEEAAAQAEADRRAASPFAALAKDD